MIARREAFPCPCAARKRDRSAERLVLFNHIAIVVVVGAVIIPVNKRYIFGQIGFFANCLKVCLAVVITRGICKLAEHIAPYHRLKAVFIGNIAHLMEVAVYNFKTVVIAVLIAVLTETHHIRLVHADMYFAGGEALGKRGENFIYKLIGSVVVRQQNICGIIYAAVLIYPFEHCVKMCQGLYTGDKLNPVFTAEGIRLFKLCL